MVTHEQARAWRGRTVLDRKGHRVGVLQDVYVDDRTGEPWAAVATGEPIDPLSMAPLAGASPRGSELRLDVSRPRLLGAPRVKPGGQLDAVAERSLFDYYGRPYEADSDGRTRFAA